MFKLDLEPTFEATVVIPQPGGVRVPVRATFRYLDEEGYREAFEATRNLPAPQFVARLVMGWDEQDDAKGLWQGMPMPFGEAALAELAKKQPRAMRAFIETYHHEALGLPLKNF